MEKLAAIEYFHLMFLCQLGDKLDKSLFALKGGCNLRFFFRSVRYSEDIDLDVRTVSLQTLQKNVRQVLAAKPLVGSLLRHGLTIDAVTEPKQTNTVQRWKMAIRLARSNLVVPTKIEFSRRQMSLGIEIEPVDVQILHRYRLFPIVLPHYGRGAAVAQKVTALLGRAEPQARDVFDLQLLSAGGSVPDLKLSVSDVEAAVAVIDSLSFEAFQGQVVAYLDPQFALDYDSPVVWKRIVSDTVQFMRSLKK